MGGFLRNIAITVLFLLPFAAGGQEVPFVKVETRQLSPLNTPRSAHVLLTLENGEVLAIGGHTHGFVPAGTAEYFDGREWREIPLNYPHDGGFAAVLADSAVLIGGGSAEPFGIGRSWGVEKYLPRERRFEPIGILDIARAYPSALAIPGDTVLVSGNWYAQDALGLYVEGEGFQTVKPVSQGRCQPYVLRSAPDNAVIFSDTDTRGEKNSEIIVDRWKGEPFSPRILSEWRPNIWMGGGHERGRIGDYSYLIPATRQSDGEVGILNLQGENFSLLETTAPVPMATPTGASILWLPYIVVNRPSRKAYMSGQAAPNQELILEIDYNPSLDGGKSGLKVYYTESSGPLSMETPFTLTPSGNILLAGGRGADNFHVNAESRLIIIGQPDYARSLSKGESPSLGWLLLLVALLVGMGLGFLLMRKPVRADVQPRESAQPQDLMSRILTLIEKEEWFRRKDLTKNILAQELGTNTTYITATVNSQTGKSFSELVASYRVAYAQNLMREHPDMLLTVVAEESGFSSEKSFFRTFKAATGLTPTQWKQQNIQ